MKKNLIIPTIIIAISLLFLASCGEQNKDSTSTEQVAKPSERTEIITEIDSMAEKVRTIENLQASYSGEVTAKAKYIAYAQEAQKEGFPQIASLYEAVSTAEHIHAKNHQAILAESKIAVPSIKPKFTVKTTIENLEGDIKGEAYEATLMYPAFIKSAENAGNLMGMVGLTYAMKTEKKHNTMYIVARDALKNNTTKDLPTTFYVCSLCGNTYATQTPARCPFCLSNSEKFIKISRMKAKRRTPTETCESM